MATYTVIEERPYLDGFVRLLSRETSRTTCRAFMGVSCGGRSSPVVYHESDARRWVDECQIGGNPNGFLHELQSRRRRR